MAERLNAHDSKSCYAGMYTRVQIPFSAPQKKDGFPVFFLWREVRVAGTLELSRGHARSEKGKGTINRYLGERRHFVAAQQNISLRHKKERVCARSFLYLRIMKGI